MATLESLERRINSLNSDSGGWLTIERYVISKAHIRDGESHEQAIRRLYPNINLSEFAPGVEEELHRRRAECAAIEQQRRENPHYD